MVNIPLFVGFHTSQVVLISAINSITDSSDPESSLAALSAWDDTRMWALLGSGPRVQIQSLCPSNDLILVPHVTSRLSQMI